MCASSDRGIIAVNIMSSRKGSGNTRTRKPAHQNTFAFRHNPKSQKTAKILASPITGLCASCHDKVRCAVTVRYLVNSVCCRVLLPATAGVLVLISCALSCITHRNAHGLDTAEIKQKGFMCIDRTALSKCTFGGSLPDL